MSFQVSTVPDYINHNSCINVNSTFAGMVTKENPNSIITTTVFGEYAGLELQPALKYQLGIFLPYYILFSNCEFFFNFRNKNHTVGFSIGGATTLFLSVSSIYSPSLRCKMLLIIPGLFAERGRSIVLWTFSSGLLIDGPIRSIYVNLQRLYDTVICMYQVTLKESCQSKVINRKVISNVSRNVQFNFSNILTCSIYFSVKIL